MTKRPASGVLLIVLWIGLTGCSGKGGDKNSDSKTAGRPSIAVEATKAVAMDFTEGIDVVGSLSPKFEAEIKSEYAGIATEVFVTEWVRVKKGTPLARIDHREIEILSQKAAAALEMAKANLLEAEVAGRRAEREYNRSLKLEFVGAVARKTIEDGLTEKEAAAARIAAAGAQLNVAEEDLEHTRTRLSKTIIRSPIDGVVSFRGVNVGDLVGEMGSPKMMFKIINTHLLNLTVTVPSREMGAVRVGQVLTFSTDAFPNRNFSGKVMFINPVVNEADRSIKVIAEVENFSDELKGGLFVKGRIVTGNRRGVLSVPRAALLSWDVAQKTGDLFVVNGVMAHRRKVQTGSIMGDSIEILSGLAPGESVVSRGGFNLKDGDRVSVTRIVGG